MKRSRSGIYYAMAACSLALLAFALPLGWQAPLSPTQGTQDGVLSLQKIITGDLRPSRIRFSPDGFACVVSSEAGHVAVFDASYRETRRWESSAQPGLRQPAYPADILFPLPPGQGWIVAGSQPAYPPGSAPCGQLSGQAQGNALWVQTPALAVRSQVPLSRHPACAASSPDGRWVLFSDPCDQGITVLDAWQGFKTQFLALEGPPGPITIDSRSRYAYISLPRQDQIAIVKLADLSVQSLDRVGREPGDLILGPSDRFLYVLLEGEGAVARIDLTKEGAMIKISTGSRPSALALSAEGSVLYVANRLEHTLCRIPTAAMQVSHRVQVHKYPVSLAFDAQQGQLWVACHSGSVLVYRDRQFAGGPSFTFPGPEGSFPDVRTRDMPGSGPVVRPSPPEAPPREVQAAPASRESAPAPDQYYVIVGSFTTEANARQALQRWRSYGYRPSIHASSQGYRVAAGAYPSREAAEDARQRLQQRYQTEAWVLQL
jgi:DNA-binding beta-propeller fold protein YncE